MISSEAGVLPSVDNSQLNHINEAGDLITEELFITSSDGVQLSLANFCLETILFEDMFSNTLMGQCLVVDSANLVNIMPLRGTETITMSFRTPSFTERIAKTFKVTKISERQFTATEREQIYMISFISNEAAIDNNTSLSQKYSGKTNEVVNTIYQNNLAVPRYSGTNTPSTLTLSSQPHSSSVSFVASSWSPLKAINWVAARSIGSQTMAPNFLFYESNKGFYFLSVEELVAQQRNTNTVFANYFYSPVADTIQNLPATGYNYTKPELLKQYNLVRKMTGFSQFDILHNQDVGYYANNLIVHDYGLKTYVENPFDYFATYNQYQHLEKTPYPIFPSDILRNYNVNNVVRLKSYKSQNDLQDPQFERWCSQRNSMLYDLSNLKFVIEVPGRTDIECGKIINFIFPTAVDKPAGTTLRMAIDPFMSGLYLITAIKHSFSLNKHTMFIEIAKDSYKIPV